MHKLLSSVNSDGSNKDQMSLSCIENKQVGVLIFAEFNGQVIKCDAWFCVCSVVALTQTPEKFYTFRFILASFQECSLHLLKEDV